MATGGGGAGGGGFNFRLARAYVEIDVDMTRYTQGIAQAQTRFNVFVSRLRADMGRLGAAFVAFRGISAGVGQGLAGVGAAAVHVRAVTTSVARLNSQLSLAITRANRLAAALGRVRAAGGQTSSPAAMTRAWGASIASVLGGLGTGLERVLRGFGTGLGRALNGFGGGLGHILARGGLGLSRALRGSGLPNLLALPARMLGALGGLFALPGRLLGGLGGLLALPGRLLGALGGLLALPGRLVGAVTSLPGRLLGGLGLGSLLGGVTAGTAVGMLGRSASRLESRQVALQRVAGLDPTGAQALTDSLRQMSVNLAAVPMDRLFDIAEMAARLGVEGPHLELFTRDMARVGQVLADIPLDEATTRIARLLAVFQQGPEAAIRLASALNRLDMASTASAREILDITSRLSGPASFLGMKPQQALALATALREAGVPLETGGTAMTQIMTRMASRKDSAKFARTAGMATGQFEATLGSDPLRAIKAFEEGLARIDRLQGPIAAVRVLDELHLDGQRVRGTILQLGRVMQQLNTYEEIAAREWDNTSSIMGGAAKVTQTLSAQWTRLGNTFGMAVQDLAMSLMPLFKGAVEGMRMLLEDIGSIIRGSGEFLKDWAEWGGNLLKTLGVALQRWETFVGLAKDFTGLQWERTLDIIRNIAKRAREIIKFEWASLWSEGGVLGTLVDWLGTAFQYIHDKAAALVNYLIEKLSELGPYLANQLQEALSKVTILGVPIVAPPLVHIFSPAEKAALAGGGIPEPPGAVRPGMPFAARAGFPVAGPPFNPWEHLEAVFGVHEGVGKDRAAGIARGMEDMAKALSFRELIGRFGTWVGGIRDRITRRGMEAESRRRFAGGGAMAADDEGGLAGGEAGAPIFPRMPSAREAARLRHREAIRAIQQRAAIPFAGDLGHDEVARRRSRLTAFLRDQVEVGRGLRAFARGGPAADPRVTAALRRAEAEAGRAAALRERVLGEFGPGVLLSSRSLATRLAARRDQRAFDAARAARLAGLPIPAPGFARLPAMELTGLMRRRVEEARAARGGLSPIQARIARVRARRHAGDGPNQVANGIRAMQQGLVRLGSFISPEMRAKAVQEAQKKQDQKSAADAIAAALGIPSGDFYQRIGLAVAQAVKGLGVLQ